MIADRAFVVFADDWGRHPSSCQHLFRRIARGNRVLWVNTVGTRTPTLSPADLARAAGKIAEWTGLPEREEGRAPDAPVEVLRPLMTPFDRYRPLRRWNARLLRRAVAAALAQRGWSDPLLVTTIPNAAGVVGRVGEAASLYYCVDEFSEWPGADREAMLEMEADLLRRVDLVVAASEALFEAKSAVHPRVRLLRHGVDWERFRAGAGVVPEALARLPRPRIAYTGLVDARLDLPLVDALADRMPEGTFVFVGPRQLGPCALDERANVHFLGPIPYEDVPALLRSVDVAFLPYLENTLTARINPLKLREFLASGVPIVATPLPEVRRYREFLWVARGRDEWLSGLRAALREGRSRADARSASVRREGWDARAEEFSGFCREAMGAR